MRNAIDAIVSPGGCAFTVAPTDSVKIARLAELRDRKRKIEARIEAIISQSAA